MNELAGVSGVKGMVKKKDILQSWKEISQYLNRDARTCIRWEKELGLPVHRIDDKSSHSKVFAYKSEIDEWLRSKANGGKSGRPILVSRKALVLGTAAAFIIAALAALLYFNLILTRSFPTQISVLVLPFENINPSSDGGYFSTGITDEISRRLANHNLFEVIRHEPKIQYTEESLLLSRRREEGPDFVLRGQAGVFEDNIRIRVSLERRSDGKVLIEKDYSTKLAELSQVQENIYNGIYKELISEFGAYPIRKDTLTDAARAPEVPESLDRRVILSGLSEEADPWKLYFKGRYYGRISTQEANEIAIEFFNRATVLDPQFAQAYIGLADCYLNYVNLNWNFNLSWVKNAEDMLARAYAIDPDIPEYYSTFAKLLLIREIGFEDETLDEAVRLLERGLAKYPDHYELNSIKGYCHFVYYGKKGLVSDFARALDYKEKAYWMSPFNIVNLTFAELLMLNREFERAIEICLCLIPLDPSLMAKFRLGEVLYYKGELQRSEEIFSNFRDSLEFQAASTAYLGMIAARNHEYEKAEAFADGVGKYATGPYGNNLKLASIYYGIGREALGREYMERFFENPQVRRIRHVYEKYIDLDTNFPSSLREASTNLY